MFERYARRAGEWGHLAMIIVRKLAKHGNCLHISLPKELLAALRWRGGDKIAVELTPDRELLVRLTRGSDVLNADIPSMRLDNPGEPITR